MQTGEGYLLNGQPDLAEQAMRALELKGDLPQLVDPRFQLGVQVDDWMRPEYSFLRRMTLNAYRLNIAAFAAQNPVVQLATISGIIVVERIIITNTNAAAQPVQLFLTPTAGPVAASASGSMRDDRQRQNAALGGGQGQMNGGTTAAPPVPFTGVFTTSIPAGARMDFDFAWVITGLAFVTVVGSTVNQSLECSMITRERAILTAER